MEKEKQMEKPRFTDENLYDVIRIFRRKKVITSSEATEALLAQLILEIRHQNLSKCCNYPEPIGFEPDPPKDDDDYEYESGLQ